MIYEVADTEERARELYEEWKAEVKASGLNAFDSFISTVKKWDKEINNGKHSGNDEGIVR